MESNFTHIKSVLGQLCKLNIKRHVELNCNPHFSFVFNIYKQIFWHFVGGNFFLEFLNIIQNIFFSPPYIYKT